jgi:ethanolamine utilization protein EutP
MKKIMFVGRVGAGKTTLTQRLRGEEIHYYKTQYVHYGDLIIDTPGEYTERANLAGALALYAYEADVVGFLIKANDVYSIYGPNVTCMVNRDVIGIVTAIDRPDADVERCKEWLRLAGYKTIFALDSKTGRGVDELLAYLSKED